MADLVESIKKAAMEAVWNSQPTEIVIGSVISTSPLKIMIDQKLILTKNQLVLSRNVTNYTASVRVSWSDTDGDTISGTKSMTFLNALNLGEKVILIRQPGGQKYVVIDRVVN